MTSIQLEQNTRLKRLLLHLIVKTNGRQTLKLEKQANKRQKDTESLTLKPGFQTQEQKFGK